MQMTLNLIGNVLRKLILKKNVFFLYFFHFEGHWIPMCALIALGYVTTTEKDLAIFLLVIAVGINSSTYLGFQVNNLTFQDIFFFVLI